jgi:Skp family chaperone for outer membrane proteins
MKTSQFLMLVAILGLGYLINISVAQNSKPQVASPTRSAVCDITYLFNQYTRTKGLAEQIAQKQKVVAAEDEKRIKAISDAKEALSLLRPGSDAYEKQVIEIFCLKTGRQGWVQVQDYALKQEHSRLTKEMYAEMLATIANVAKSRGFAIVIKKNAQVQADNSQELLRAIDKQSLLYCDRSVNITEAVLAQLNADYQKRGVPSRP